MTTSFESMRAGYRKLWDRMHVTRPLDAERVAKAILGDMAVYQAVEKDTGVPWFWIACAHQRESARDFGGILHNGERIIGTGRKTSKVPAGRGPFGSWNEAAIDAIRYKALHAVEDWSLERCLYEFERYNGFGYVARGINSPYVWAGTSLQQRGKYVADGQFDANHWDTQLGCAAVLKSIVALDAGAEQRLGEASAPIPGTESADDPGEGVPLSAYTTHALMAELMTRAGIAVTFHFEGD